MKRLHLLLTVLVVVAWVAACAPAILGGPTPDTTTTLCGDGVTLRYRRLLLQHAIWVEDYRGAATERPTVPDVGE